MRSVAPLVVSVGIPEVAFTQEAPARGLTHSLTHSQSSAESSLVSNHETPFLPPSRYPCASCARVTCVVVVVLILVMCHYEIEPRQVNAVHLHPGWIRR